MAVAMKVDKVLKCSSVQLQFNPYKNKVRKTNLEHSEFRKKKKTVTEKGYKRTGC